MTKASGTCSKIGGWSWALSGILAGASVLFRLELGAAALLAAVPQLWMASKRECFSFIVGCLCGASFLVFHLLTAPNSMADLIWYPLTNRQGRFLPLEGVWLETITLLLFAALPILSLLMLQKKAGSAKVACRLRSYGLVSAIVLPQYIQRADVFHFEMTAALIMPLGVAALFEYLRATFSPISIRVVLVAFFALVIVKGGLSTSTVKDTIKVDHNRRWTYEASQEETRNLLEVFTLIDSHASSGKRIFIGPSDLRSRAYNDTSLYYLLPAFTPSGYYLELNPDHSSLFQRRFQEAIKNAHLLLLSSNFVEPSPGGRIDFAAEGALSREFDLLRIIGPYQVWARKGPT